MFGANNFCSVISFQKTGSMAANLLPSTVDYILWYARNIDCAKYYQLYEQREAGDTSLDRYDQFREQNGQIRRFSTSDIGDEEDVAGERLQLTSLFSDGASTTAHEFVFRGAVHKAKSNAHWKTTVGGLARLAQAERIEPQGDRLRYVRLASDFNVIPLSDRWESVQIGKAALYVVQTAAQVVQRCMLMTTDPGDLVLDPTCGSGTTAYVAEQWGRRWITIDTSRVALAIARQRLLTAKFDYYKLRPVTPEEAQRNPHGTWLSDPLDPAHSHETFQCKQVPHVTLRSIARNTNLDLIFARHEPILETRLAACNNALSKVTDSLRNELLAKLAAKQRAAGARSITDADRRRWTLPPKNETWQHWQVPFDTDVDWPKELIAGVKAYREAWRAKMDEVNACIAANAASEELVDQPEVVRGVVRVSGPFTVEAVQPPELSLAEAVVIETKAPEFEGAPDELPDRFLSIERVEVFHEAQNVAAYLDQMVRLLSQDGVRFPNNKQMRFTRLEPIFESGSATGIHAEGRWLPINGNGSKKNGDEHDDGPPNVGVAFGPQYGPVTAQQVEELIKPASRRYDDLVIAGFSFDGPAQQVIEEAQHPKLRIHIAHIRPDVNPGMSGLLKEQPGSQLFTVFGQPRTSVKGPNAQGDYVVRMEGVDIYNPIDNSIASTGADKVAAWFLDSDYDGRTFCITQAFFPDRSAWDKLAKALGDVVDAAAFEAFPAPHRFPSPPASTAA